MDSKWHKGISHVTIQEEEVSGSENVKDGGRAQRDGRVEGATPRH